MADDNDFLEVIAAEVAADRTDMALREDFIALLLQHDVDRAAHEISAFENDGGDAARVRVMRARLMAARLRRGEEPNVAAQASASGAPHDKPVPAPGADDSADDDLDQPGLWDAERPSVTLADVAGLAEVKEHLNETFLAPLRNPEMAAAFGQKPGGSLLMYGPPGCGKTYIAKAIAGDLGASFIHVTLADLLSKWLGDSEKAIQSIFHDARAAAPCVIFFDEFDAIGGRRSSGGGGSQSIRMIVTQLLEELDGVQSVNDGVYFLAATNRPWDIDPALRRPGRIDKTVVVLPPDAIARAAILQGALEGKPTDNVDVTQIAAATEGFSGADIAQVAKVALQKSLSASMKSATVVPVTTAALQEAAADITASTTSWFDQVAPVLDYGIDDGTFAQLRAYRVKHGMK
ncbi:AAA family ATPase [Microbacterium mitrae]|uniref:ATP-binding protein n=1 Tax=Microbacterium mitrae TaxID=664640 RepID=UPI001FE8D127|nr:ATP-binding protein [Microbacterium mitrae]